MARRLSVLLLVRELGIGGCERDVTRIATGLDRSRFEPHVGAFRPQGMRSSELRAANVPILHLPVTSFRSRSALIAAGVLRDYIRRHNIQVVHSYDVPTDLFAAPLARLFRTPVVVTSQLSYRDLYHPVTWRLLRITDRIADRVVVNSEEIRRHVIEDEGVPVNKVFLCYNGVDTSVFYPSAASRPAPLEDASPVIGIVCALREEKRVDLLIEAFARVRHLRAGMKLLVVGSGVQLADLEAKAARLDVRADCVFEPTSSDVPAWMRAIDIFVLPSRSESFSNALLEAMASGCCPVGSRVGGTPELIADEESGLLFKSGDVVGLANQLERVIADDSLRKRFGRVSAQRARALFSKERSIATMEDFYTTLVHSKSATRRGPAADYVLKSGK